MGKFANTAKRVRKLRRDLQDGHRDATEDAMKEMRHDVQTVIRANDSVARTKLITDVRVTDTTDTELIAQSVTVPDWAKYLEHGTGERGDGTTAEGTGAYKAPTPGPPFMNIWTWVVAKNITPTEFDSQAGLASAIADSIGDEGTFPHPFLRPVWHSNRGYRNVIDANKQAIRRAVRRF